MSTHSTNDEFFTDLAALIEKVQQKGHGAVYLTQKRLTYDLSPSPGSPDSTKKVADDPFEDTHPPNPLPILIRATDGHSQSRDRARNPDKVKLSTVVQPAELDSFFARYADVCKAGMQSLKKRDRSRRKKDKRKKAPAAGGGADAGAGAGQGKKA